MTLHSNIHEDVQKPEKNSLNLMNRLQRYETPRCRLRAVGVCLPERIVTNEELVQGIDIEPQLRARLPAVLSRLTGIRTRRHAPHGTAPSDLALKASLDALQKANLTPSDIDTVIFASTDFDFVEPATANMLQEKLGIPAVNSFDVKNACNSVLQGVNVANSLIISGAATRVLIASGEVGSHWYHRRITSIEDLDVKLGGLTLGDAGGALILEASPGDSGIVEVNLLTLGEHWRLCHLPENPSWRSHALDDMGYWFYLNMPELARVAREWTVRYFHAYAGFRQEERGEDHPYEALATIIPHQISKRFIDDIGKETCLSRDKLCIIADRYGNTGSTAIPLGLYTLLEEGRLRHGSGDEIILFGAASGFSIGHVRLKL